MDLKSATSVHRECNRKECMHKACIPTRDCTHALFRVRATTVHQECIPAGVQHNPNMAPTDATTRRWRRLGGGYLRAAMDAMGTT